MAEVFISYSHQDREDVAEISRALTDMHVSVWSDQNIRAGKQWMNEIDGALTEEKVMVLCLSREFLASDWAQFKIGVALRRAREAGLRVIPLIMKDSVVPAALNRFQFLDAGHLSS